MDENEHVTAVEAPQQPATVRVSTDRDQKETDESLKTGLSRLNIEHLVDLLERNGFIVKPNTPKGELVQAVIEMHHRQIQVSEETVAKAIVETDSTDEQMVRMRFMSLESPNASYEFCHPGPKGFKKDSRGNAIKAPKWSFMHNRSYTVPYWVVKHLNSLMVPADVKVETDSQGFIHSLYSGDTNRQPRFSCTIELSPEQEKRMIQKG